MMDRKLEGRRPSSKLSELVVAKPLDLTLQAAQPIVLELELREMTGRGRFRAWGRYN